MAIKIVKQSADGSNTVQLYPEGDAYYVISTSESIAGVKIPEIITDVEAGDTINFILNQCDENGRDGTMWTNEIEYMQ